jgi:nucleotide-binding universal stress UspA family protein
MSTALVPIDGSDAALRALRHAMTVAEGIQIINVQPKADAPALLLHMTQADIDKAQVEHGRAHLVEARKMLADAGRAYREHVLVGEPATTIAQIAKSEGVDVIVMGTRGMSALGNLALGSTATKVVHLADVPVTLVK